MCREFGIDVPVLTQGQVDALTRYHWPGNIRELKNVIERAVILSRGGALRLDLSLPETDMEAPGDSDAATATDSPLPFLTESQMKEHQRDNMIRALEYAGWRISGTDGAADLLQIRPTTLSDRMRAFEIHRPKAD